MKQGKAKALTKDVLIFQGKRDLNDEKNLNQREDKAFEETRIDSKKLRERFIKFKRSIRRKSSGIL